MRNFARSIVLLLALGLSEPVLAGQLAELQEKVAIRELISTR